MNSYTDPIPWLGKGTHYLRIDKMGGAALNITPVLNTQPKNIA